MARFWWIRHAPTDAAPGVIVGASDLPCRPVEPARAAALARWLPRRAAAAVVTSGLVRTEQTAAALGLSPTRREPALAEQSFGAWQGARWDAVDAAAFWADPATARPPQGESFADQVARVSPVIEGLAADHADHDIVVVAHAGTIRAALVLALQMAPAQGLRLVVDPLSLTRIDIVPGGAAVRAVNWRPEP